MTKPRFIAGAVCPRCGAHDRTVVELLPDGRRRRCVSCGFAEEVSDTHTPRRAPDAVAPVRIVDPRLGPVHPEEGDP